MSIHFDNAKVASVSAADFNVDGKLDFLIQTHPFNMSVSPVELNTDITQLQIYYGDYTRVTDTKMLPEAHSGQVSILQYGKGQIHPSLIGNRRNSEGVLESTVWKALLTTEKVLGGKPFAAPHSFANVDFDGDCMPDFFVDRADGTSEIWIMDPKSGVPSLKQTFASVAGRGQVTFADFDGDGAVDMLFPVCYPSDTCETTNELRIYYNSQQPICASVFSKNCRRPNALCTADSSFKFANFGTTSSNDKVVIVKADQFPSQTRLFASPASTGVPLTVRAGDYNVDRFADLLVPMLPSSSKVAQTALWKNLPCTSDLCGDAASKAKRRTFQPIMDSSAGALNSINGAFGASWFDLDESGTLDILVTTETVNSLNQHVFSLVAVTNNYFNDGYFIKTLGLNGLCTVNCNLKNIKLGQKPYGVNQHGASWKYTLSDLSGRQLVNAFPQLPQSAYSPLQTPYVLNGLGRPANYIDYIYMGFPVYDSKNGHSQSWPGVIPNSQVVVSPYPTNSPDKWAIELYISPSGALLWIALGVALCLLLSGGAIVFFQWREKKADEAEKKEREHLFSFNAM